MTAGRRIDVLRDGLSRPVGPVWTEPFHDA